MRGGKVGRCRVLAQGGVPGDHFTILLSKKVSDIEKWKLCKKRLVFALRYGGRLSAFSLNLLVFCHSTPPNHPRHRGPSPAPRLPILGTCLRHQQCKRY